MLKRALLVAFKVRFYHWSALERRSLHRCEALSSSFERALLHQKPGCRRQVLAFRVEFKGALVGSVARWPLGGIENKKEKKKDAVNGCRRQMLAFRMEF